MPSGASVRRRRRTVPCPRCPDRDEAHGSRLAVRAVGSVGLDELQPQLPDDARVDLADAGLGDAEDLPDLGERQPLEVVKA